MTYFLLYLIKFEIAGFVQLLSAGNAPKLLTGEFMKLHTPLEKYRSTRVSQKLFIIQVNDISLMNKIDVTDYQTAIFENGNFTINIQTGECTLYLNVIKVQCQTGLHLLSHCFFYFLTP